MVDGGEGFICVLVVVIGGEIYNVIVIGFVRCFIDFFFGVFGRRDFLVLKIIVFEMVVVVGFSLVLDFMWDFGIIIMYGVGEFIRYVLDVGV